MMVQEIWRSLEYVQCTERRRFMFLVCCHCLSSAYSYVFTHPSVSALGHFLCLSTQVSVLPLFLCHSAEMKPFVFPGTNYKSINSLSYSPHVVSADLALCNPEWQLIFKGCTWLMVVSPDLRYWVDPVALA